MTQALTTVVQAEIGIAIRIASASVVVKRAPTAATGARNAVLVTLIVSAAAGVMSVVVRVGKKRIAIENATLNPAKAYVGRTARVKKQDAETDVIVMMDRPTRAGLLLAPPMMRAVFVLHLLWEPEPLRLHHLPRRLLCPMTKTAPLAAGALAETGETATRTEIANVSAVVTAVETGTTTATVAAQDIASVDVPTPTKTPMEMHGARGWEVTTNALVEGREIPVR
jgi:hypothetical protein